MEKQKDQTSSSECPRDNLQPEHNFHMGTGPKPSPGIYRAELVFLGAFSSLGFRFLILFIVLFPEVGFLAVKVLINPQEHNCPEQRKENEMQH